MRTRRRSSPGSREVECEACGRRQRNCFSTAFRSGYDGRETAGATEPTPAGGERVLAQDQREQARKLFTYLDTQTTAIADTVYRNEVADYTCRKQFAR